MLAWLSLSYLINSGLLEDVNSRREEQRLAHLEIGDVKDMCRIDDKTWYLIDFSPSFTAGTGSIWVMDTILFAMRELDVVNSFRAAHDLSMLELDPNRKAKKLQSQHTRPMEAQRHDVEKNRASSSHHGTRREDHR